LPTGKIYANTRNFYIEQRAAARQSCDPAPGAAMSHWHAYCFT
jgi:hypothetical protein